MISISHEEARKLGVSQDQEGRTLRRPLPLSMNKTPVLSARDAQAGAAAPAAVDPLRAALEGLGVGQQTLAQAVLELARSNHLPPTPIGTWTQIECIPERDTKGLIVRIILRKIG